MLKISLCLLSIIVISASCLKKDIRCPYVAVNNVAPAAEQDTLLKYLTDNNIEATKYRSGMYYQIIDMGSGTDSAGLCSDIQISYEGKLTNGRTFDQSPGTMFVLGALIEGWKQGIPLIRKGGRIKLYVPPSLGYGSSGVTDNNGVAVIPGGSILIFDIVLLGFSASS